MATGIFARLKLLILLTLVSGSAFSQNPPAAGVILNREPLDQMLRDRGAEAIFMNLRGLISEQVRKALRNAERGEDGKPYNINDSREVNITREFLRKPVLQIEYVPEIQSNLSDWLIEVKKSYEQVEPKIPAEEIDSEMQTWKVFLEKISSTTDDTPKEDVQTEIDQFFKQKLGETRTRRDFLPEQIPLFKMQKEVWLETLRRTYQKDVPEDQRAWVERSLKNWELFFDDSEDWSLFVNYNIDLYPNFESLSLDHDFPKEGPLAHGVVQAELDPVLHIQSINIFLRNPSTGETISLGLPEKYNAEWKMSDKVKVLVPTDVNFDLQRREPVQVDIAPVETNLGPGRMGSGLFIRSENVNEFLRDVFNPERIQTVLAQIKPSFPEGEEGPQTYEEMQTYDRVFRQLESDVENFLQHKDIEIAVWLVRTETGEVDTKIGILNDELRSELAALRAEAESDQQNGERGTGRASLIAEFRTSIPLEIAKASFDLDLESQNIVADFDFLKLKKLNWSVKYFEFPVFLFGNVENPIAQNIIAGLRDQNFASDNIEVETNIEFLSPESGLKLRLPLKWEATEGSEVLVPQIDTENLFVDAPGLAKAKVQDIRFRAAENLPWVGLDFKKPQEISDQIYTQLRPFMRNIQQITGENVYRLVEQEVAQYLETRLASLETDLPSPQPTSSVPPRLKILSFALPPNALNINWDAELEIAQANKNQRLMKPGFHFLPKPYQIYAQAPALHRVRTSIKLPKEIRLRVENFDHPEAFIRTLEFTLRARAEQELVVHWKFVQDTEGRLLMLPELLNAEEILKNYKPVTEGEVEEGGPLIEGVVAKGRWASGVDTASRVGAIMGGVAGSYQPEGILDRIGVWTWRGIGAVSSSVAGVVENKKDEKVRSELQTAMDDATEKLLPSLIEVLVKKSNGYLLTDLNSDEAKAGAINTVNISKVSNIQAEDAEEGVKGAAPLRGLQNQFERLLISLETKFPVRRVFGEITFDGKSISQLATEKGREAVVDTLKGSGPIEDWPDVFTNPGLQETWFELRETAKERVTSLPQDNVEAIEGDPNNLDENQRTINAIVQGPVKSEIQSAINEPLQNLKITSPKADSNQSDQAPQVQIDLPEFLCIGTVSSSPSSDLIPVWAWYEETNSSHTEQNPAPQLDGLILSMFKEHPEWGAKAPDALLVMGFEDIQKRIIEPNLEYARKMVAEKLSKEQPGTELLIGGVEIRVESDSHGREAPVAYAQLRLKQKKGFIKFDSGSEYVEMKVPLQISLYDTFNDRPETNESEPNAGYGLNIAPQYPIEILDPNSGSVITHLIKKKIAYPTLAEEIVKAPQYFSIPRTIGLPTAENAVQIEVRQPRFGRDASGKAYVFVPLHYSLPPLKDNTYGNRTIIGVDSLQDRQALNHHVKSQLHRQDFVFRRWIRQLMEDSADNKRLFSSRQPVQVEFLEPSDGGDFVREDAERSGHLEFRARVQIRQAGQNGIQFPENLEISVPFEHFQAQAQQGSFWLLDADIPRVISHPVIPSLNPATQDFLNYLKEADGRALRLDEFR